MVNQLENFINAFCLLLGIIGSVILIYAITQVDSDAVNAYYAIGAGLMLITALRYKLVFFVALETILLCGHGASILQINRLVTISLPILLSIQVIIYIVLSGLLTNLFPIIGTVGIACISVGFIVNNQLIFFIGGFCIASYAFYLWYHGKDIALLWAITNTIFALNAFYLLLRGTPW